MDYTRYIEIKQLCSHYNMDINFLQQVEHTGIVKFIKDDVDIFLAHDELPKIEKAHRLNAELNVNVEGIDVIFNLLDKIDALQKEMQLLQNKLSHS